MPNLFVILFDHGYGDLAGLNYYNEGVVYWNYNNSFAIIDQYVSIYKYLYIE